MNDNSPQDASSPLGAYGASGRVYVLRVWYEGGSEPRRWRSTVREGHQGERRSFASVDACLEHLYAELLRQDGSV